MNYYEKRFTAKDVDEAKGHTLACSTGCTRPLFRVDGTTIVVRSAEQFPGAEEKRVPPAGASVVLAGTISPFKNNSFTERVPSFQAALATTKPRRERRSRLMGEEELKEWIADKVGGSVAIETVSVRYFHNRSKRTDPVSCDVAIRGVVIDRDRLAQLLGKGLGRCKAFGRGMLTVRPAGPQT